jgi:hypothetical protein
VELTKNSSGLRWLTWYASAPRMMAINNDSEQ